MRFIRSTFLFLILICLSINLFAQSTEGDSGSNVKTVIVGKGGGSSAGGATIQTDEFTGATTNSISIPVPPGVGGMEPSINLTYNSYRRNMNSWLGLGWELDMGTIWRTPENGFTDYSRGRGFEVKFAGQSETLAFDSHVDNAALYGISNSFDVELYSARIESAHNIYLHIVDNSDPYLPHDKGWVVIDKSGKRYIFGDSNASIEDSTKRNISTRRTEHLVARWLLTKVIDTNGNQMNISYGNDMLPVSISYDDIQILFNQNTSAEKRSTPYFPIFKQALVNSQGNGSRLKEIIIKKNGIILQQFRLTYQAGAYSALSQLVKIQQYGKTDSQTLEPTVFKYNTIDTGKYDFKTVPMDFQASRSSDNSIQGFLNKYVTLIDMNGDALPDQVAGSGDGRIFIFKNNLHDFQLSSAWDDPLLVGQGANPFFKGKLTDTIEGHQNLLLMDINGDALPDRILRHSLDNSHSNFRIAFNRGDRFDSNVVEWADPYVGDWAGTLDNDRGLIDMNGDSLPDRIIKNTHDGNTGFDIYFNTGAGFRPNPVYWTDPSSVGNPSYSAIGKINAYDGSRLYATIRDMNGDGLPDRIFKTRIYRNEVDQGFGFFVAFNRDGLGWYLPQEYQGNLDIDANVDGIHTILMNDPVQGSNSGFISDKTYDLIDFNGDGYLDRVESVPADDTHPIGKFYIYPFKGLIDSDRSHSFSSNPIIINDNMFGIDTGGWKAEGYINNRDGEDIHTLTMDINGDGYPDRITLKKRNRNIADNKYYIYPLLVNDLVFSDTNSNFKNQNVNQPIGNLKSTDDGRGGETAVEYFPSSWGNTQSTAHRYLPLNLFLTHRVFNRDDLMPVNTANTVEERRHPLNRMTAYQYSGGNFYVRYTRMNGSSIESYHEAQFNGFQKVTKTIKPFEATGFGKENWSPVVTQTYFHQVIGDVTINASNTALFDITGYTHWALSGKPYLQISKENGVSNFSVRTDSKWEINNSNNSSYLCNGLCRPHLTNQTKSVQENSSSTLRISSVDFNYDDLDNPISETHKDGFSGNVLLTKATEFYPASYFGSTLFIRDRPKMQKQSVGTTIYRQKEFDYDKSNGNPTIEKFYLSPGNYQTITRTFYPNGNIHEITSLDGIKKTIEYDPDGIFPIREKINLNGTDLVTSRTFNRLFGEIEEEIGPHGNGKKIELDDFGRPVTEWLRDTQGQLKLVKGYEYLYFNGNIITNQNRPLLQVKVWEPQDGFPDTNFRGDKPSQIMYSLAAGAPLQKCSLTERGNYRQIFTRVADAGRKEITSEPSFTNGCTYQSNYDYKTQQRLYVTKKDLQGRIIESIVPDGDAKSPLSGITYAYSTDINHHLVKNTYLPQSRFKTEIYDELERLIEVQEPQGAITKFDYNPVGDLRHVYEGNSLLTTIDYDALGRKTSMTDADMGTWNYYYDSYGRMDYQIDAKGQKISFIYESPTDKLGRLLRKEYYQTGSNTPEKYETYTYDQGAGGYNVEEGELFQVEEFDGVNHSLRRTRFGYEPLYRRNQKVSRLIPGVAELTQSMEYDFRGQLKSTRYPSEESLFYKYTYAGNMTKVCSTSSCNESHGEAYYSIDPANAFDEFGNLQSEKFGNGVETNFSYYPNSHRASSKKTGRNGESYSERNFEYDVFSNLTALRDPLSLMGSQALSSVIYDSLDRMKTYQVASTGKVETLDYSTNGNILKNTASYGNQAYEYTSARPHAVTKIGSEIFTYDNNGNMTSDAARTMTYNAQNQLLKVTMKNGLSVDYDYDYTGARVSKKVTRTDPLGKITQTTTHYLGDAMEIKGDQLILNVSVGERRIATKSLGKLSELSGLGGGTFKDTGIDLPLNFPVLCPLLILILTLFFIASFREITLRPSYARGPPLIIKPIITWASYVDNFRQSFFGLRYRTFPKLVSLTLSFLFFIQIPLISYAGDTGIDNSNSTENYFYYVHGDHLGSSHVLTEGSILGIHSGVTYKKGDLLQRFEYAPFGKEQFVLNPNLKFDPRYTGQQYDTETGLMYYKARFYNPQLGRFIQADTIVPSAKNLQAYNRYSYVLNNPLKYTDPDGHGFWGWFKKLFGAFFGALVAVLVTVLTAGLLAPGAFAFSFSVFQGLSLSNMILAGAIGGLVGGAVGGGITGGLKGALFGALFGALGGALSGGTGHWMMGLKEGTRAVAMAVMGAIGAGLSYATGGWQGLLTFGAGVLGSMAGAGLAGCFKGSPSKQLSSGYEKKHEFSFDHNTTASAKGPSKLSQTISDALDDGRLTLSEASHIYRLNTNPNLVVEVDASKLTVVQSGLTRPNGNIPGVVLNDDYLVHGQVTLIPHTDGTYGIAPGLYNFEMHSGDSIMTNLRNLATLVGHVYAGRGTPFTITYRGNANAYTTPF